MPKKEEKDQKEVAKTEEKVRYDQESESCEGKKSKSRSESST